MLNTPVCSRTGTGPTISVRPDLLRSILLLAVALRLIVPTSRTSADPDATGSRKYAFVVYGDVRSHPDDHRKVVADILKMHPDFIIGTGDYVSNGNSQTEWDEYKSIVNPFAEAHIPIYMAQGNHDVGLYALHSTKYAGASGNGIYYAVTLHGSRFIIVDSFDPADFGPGSPEYIRLDHELATAEKDAVNTFVAFHVPPYSVGAHGPNLEAQRDIVPLFVKYHVRAVFNGHDRNYYRTTRNGVLYIVSGGGGAPLYDPDNAKSAIPGDVYATVHNFVLCTVDGAKVKCEAYAVDHDPTSPTAWFLGSAKTNAVVTHVHADGPHDSIIPSVPGGPIIDAVSADKP